MKINTSTVICIVCIFIDLSYKSVRTDSPSHAALVCVFHSKVAAQIYLNVCLKDKQRRKSPMPMVAPHPATCIRRIHFWQPRHFSALDHCHRILREDHRARILVVVQVILLDSHRERERGVFWTWLHNIDFQVIWYQWVSRSRTRTHRWMCHSH